MKNIKIYQRTLSLLTATAISLTLASCSRKENISEQQETFLETNPIETTFPEEKIDEDCTHLSLNIGGVYETFKECDGYDIYLRTNYGAGLYTISKNDRTYLNGIATDYNIMHINHNLYESENKAIQKVKIKESN